jgi:hypothetical protein
MAPTTGRLDISAWRNDDWFEFPLRVVGLDLTDLAMVLDIRRIGDISGPPLVRLEKVDATSIEAQGLRVAGVTIDGGQISDLRIRMDRGTLQDLPYYGALGVAADFEYALLIGGRTRLRGKFILPAHAYGSDNAPDDRPSNYGDAYAARDPEPGATLTISQDGGATVVIDGAELTSTAGLQAKAAADRADAALEIVEGISSTSYRAVTDYTAREMIPLDQRGNGLRVQTMSDGRVSEWRTDMFGPGAWTGLLTEEELTRRQLQHGTQGPETIDGLPATLEALSAGVAAVTARLDYTGLDLTSVTLDPAYAEIGSTVNTVNVSWTVTGKTPTTQRLTWTGGQGAWGLKPGDRAATVPTGGIASGSVLVIGDSLSFYTYAEALAAVYGLTVITCAVYAQSSRRQALRVGAFDITLTLANNLLPAAGTDGTVTLINGGPTTNANPDAILHTYDGDTTPLGHQIEGTIAGRTVTLDHQPATAPNLYNIRQPNGAAIAVPPGSIFRPKFADMMAIHEAWICVGRNDIDKPDQVNASVDAIMAKRGRARTLLFDIITAANEVPGHPTEVRIRANNNRLRLRYEGSYVIDAQGRGLLDRLIAAGGANGIIADALRDPADPAPKLHLNGPPTNPAKGYGVWKAIAQEFRDATMSGAMALTADTEFKLLVRDANAPSGAAGAEKTVTAQLRYRDKGHAGILDKAEGITSAEANALSESWWAEGVARTLTITVTAPGFLWFSQPASEPDPSAFKANGFAVVPVRTLRDHTTATGEVVQYADFRLGNRSAAGAVINLEIIP